MDTLFAAAQATVGAVAGVGLGWLSMMLLQRQVEALTTGRRGVDKGVLSGLVLRLSLLGGGLALCLVWSTYAGLACAGALLLTRWALIRRAKGKR